MDGSSPSLDERLLNMNESSSTSGDIFDVLSPLNSVHKAWSVDPSRVSGQLLVEVSREKFHENGSSAYGLALNHPQQSG